MDAVLKFLYNHHSEHITGSVSLHNKLFGPVGGTEDWVIAADLLELKKGSITLRRPDELFILASEVVKGICDVGEVLNECSVEVAET